MLKALNQIQGQNSLYIYRYITENCLWDDRLGMNSEKHVIRRKKYADVGGVTENMQARKEQRNFLLAFSISISVLWFYVSTQFGLKFIHHSSGTAL